MINLPVFRDERGELVVWDTDQPFKVERVFWIYEVPKRQVRAGHAHETCEQVIIAVTGSFTAVVNGQSFWMTDPSKALHLPAGKFLLLKDFSPDAVCLVLASEPYNDDRIS